ncbi:MAG: toxin [Nitrospirae bacterium]|nr:MAG: toxin [Nitrospirota bacterium]
MKYIRWNEEKNRKLKEQRGISFEDVIIETEKGHILDILEHPNQQRYAGQRIFVVEINGYAYLVPFIETEKEVFLKTVIPSRKATKKYLSRRKK